MSYNICTYNNFSLSGNITIVLTIVNQVYTPPLWLISLNLLVVNICCNHCLKNGLSNNWDLFGGCINIVYSFSTKNRQIFLLGKNNFSKYSHILLLVIIPYRVPSGDNFYKLSIKTNFERMV